MVAPTIYHNGQLKQRRDLRPLLFRPRLTPLSSTPSPPETVTTSPRVDIDAAPADYDVATPPPSYPASIDPTGDFSNGEGRGGYGPSQREEKKMATSPPLLVRIHPPPPPHRHHPQRRPRFHDYMQLTRVLLHALWKPCRGRGTTWVLYPDVDIDLGVCQTYGIRGGKERDWCILM